MATLVLTAVGGAIGGPVGAGIGSLLGQAADRALLSGVKRREGPRLADLAVQMSTYGAAIPKLFGTMRVAGTVIWATDLIETRGSSRAGKGQPGVTTYSYSASFAVALSARPIIAVGRIWADGKLLRGAAGDFKAVTGFRLHRGDEEQMPDPLIASAVGVDRASAHRGMAYAVFEGLQLADFGNRIPSLTFEVIADTGPVAIGAIAAALAPGLKGEAAAMLDGFAAGEGNVAATLSLLGEAAGAGFVQRDGGIRMTAPDEAATVIDDTAMRAGGKATPPRERRMAAADSVPREIVFRHYDPARDYQAGVQRARRPGSGLSVRQVDMPAVLTATAARAMADAMLRRAEAARTRRIVRSDLSALSIPPGAILTIRGESGRWQVVETRCEAMLVSLTLVPVAAPALGERAASSGTAVTAPDDPIGATVLRVFETPVPGDDVPAGPVMTIAANGTGAGWRRAALLYSLDDGASWTPMGATAAPAVIGETVGAVPGGPTTLFDMVATIEVDLLRADMTLEDADDRRLDAGANLALLGDELIQFGRAEPIGAARWRLSRLLRGRRGTDGAGCAAGERFVLLDREAVATIVLPASAIGATLQVMASGIGDAAPAIATAPVTGVSVRPPSPVHARIERRPDGGKTLSWTRRSRAGWRWIDGVDVPLAEEAERYRVTIDGVEGRRPFDTAAPSLDLPGDAAGGNIMVRQLGTLSESAALIVALPSS